MVWIGPFHHGAFCLELAREFIILVDFPIGQRRHARELMHLGRASGFFDIGEITSQANSPREIQFGLKVVF